MKKHLIITTFVISLLMLIGTFFDYQITNLLYCNGTTFVKISDMFAVIFPSFVLMVAFSILFRKQRQARFNKRYIRSIIYFSSGLITLNIIFIYPTKYLISSSNSIFETYLTIYTLIFFLLSIILYTFITQIFRNIKERNIDFYAKRAWLLICFVFSAIIITQIIKFSWSRPRYLTINEGLADFKNWYQISGFSTSDSFHSFPSGHTNSAFTILGLLLLLKDEKNVQKLYPYFLFVPSLVGLGRIIEGRHFLTDITIGSYIAILIFFILHYYAQRIKINS